MKPMVQVGKVLEGAAATLESTVFAGTPVLVGRGKAPDGAGTGYVTLYASTTASRDEGSYDNPEGSSRVRIQASTAGSSDAEANRLMDLVSQMFFAVSSTIQDYEYPIVVADHSVWSRTKVADVGSANEGDRFQRIQLLDLWVSAL